MTRFFLLLTCTLIISCGKRKPSLTAQQIVDKTLVRSGADKVGSAQIEVSI